MEMKFKFNSSYIQMNSYLTGNSSHSTSNVAYKRVISTIEGLTKRALYLFKLELFSRVLEKQGSNDDYSLDQGLISLSQRAIHQQKNIMEVNILSCDDDLDFCLFLNSF